MNRLGTEAMTRDIVGKVKRRGQGGGRMVRKPREFDPPLVWRLLLRSLDSYASIGHSVACVEREFVEVVIPPQFL